MIKKWLAQYQFNKQSQALQKSPAAAIYSPPQITSNVFSDYEYFVLDFETTGLQPKTDKILSAGWTTIKHGRMQWATCSHQLIKYTEAIPDSSVAIHHIMEQEAALGQPVDIVFNDLMQQLSGKILVAHFADIEVNFLQQLAQKIYGHAMPFIFIDTLKIAFAMNYKHSTHVPHNALNLSALRENYNLPRYKAHNALSDSVATAELLLLQVEELKAKKQGGINQLLAMSRS